MCNSSNCNHGDDDFFSNLEGDDIFADATGPINAKDVARAESQAGLVRERCPKGCRNGKFVSYSGRILGDCFTCKGTGFVTFKNAAPVRAARTAAAKVRKERNAAERAQEWAVAHAAEAAWLSAKAGSFDFATSLQASLLKYGSLTDNQVAAVRRCIVKDEARDAERAAAKVVQAERAANAPTVTGIKPIEDAFASAVAKGIKRPKVRLGDFKFSLAPATGRNAGAIYVTDRTGDTYLGKIVDARFFGVRDCTPSMEAQIVEVCSDPAAAAVAYGRRTGSCCICARELTNHDSIERGIGPICAERFGW
jgi:hypothetical protein